MSICPTFVAFGSIGSWSDHLAGEIESVLLVSLPTTIVRKRVASVPTLARTLQTAAVFGQILEMENKTANGCRLVHCGRPSCVTSVIRRTTLARNFAIPVTTIPFEWMLSFASCRVSEWLQSNVPVLMKITLS